MNTNIYLWQYLAEFFFEWETLQATFVEKIKPHISYLVTPFRKFVSFMR